MSKCRAHPTDGPGSLLGRSESAFFFKKQFIYLFIFGCIVVLVVALRIFEQRVGCFLFEECWLSSCGSWAQSPCGRWDLNSLSRD